MDNRTISRRSFVRKSALMGAAAAGVAQKGIVQPVSVASPHTHYKPTWESLDAHPCPEWFRDAKIGIYFHWGVCSVPAWAPRSDSISYAEWYWHSMKDTNNPTWNYHRETYGEHFTYDDFIPMFKAENYDPAKWVDFAVAAGAKYIFVNAKHHDGFCLWPSRVTNRNAFKMGPKRDLIGPLAEAARNKGLKFGFYYSFYEWYNPLYTGTPHPYAGLIELDDYVDDFMIPQVTELIDMYHPDFLYFDGEWDHPHEFWKSRDFVAYYYNQAAQRNQNVMVNDRFGKGSRGRHGDVYNVEYHYGSESEGLLTHKWSYWRGVGKTFGYNRDTNPEDCLTPIELIHMVVEGVSRNGNFDINVGPTAEGMISDVEKEPLLALGRWLRVNGEAIYGSRVSGLSPDDGMCFTAKGDYVYAIFLRWTEEKFFCPSVRAVEGSPISMLGVPGTLKWRQNEKGLTIEYPSHKSRPSHCAFAWTFKIRV